MTLRLDVLVFFYAPCVLVRYASCAMAMTSLLPLRSFSRCVCVCVFGAELADGAEIRAATANKPGEERGAAGAHEGQQEQLVVLASHARVVG